MRNEQAEAKYSRAIRDLGIRNRAGVGDGRRVRLVCLIRLEDTRPFRAPWWTGKDVSLLAVDVDGNFALRHCGGQILFWDRESQATSTIAPSLLDFVESID